jgi:hypothetical protein
MSTFFVIHHRTKAGCEKELAARFAASDPEFNKAEGKRFDAAGFHAHQMMVGTGQIFCVWEAKEGKAPSDMQAHIDSEMPFLTNVVYTVEASINGLKPKNFFGDDGTAHCLEDFQVLGEQGCDTKSNFYMIEHICHPGKVDDWIKMTESFVPKAKEDEEAWGKMMESMKESGFYAHSSLPVSRSDGHVFCLWELKEGQAAAELQKFHDGNMGKGGAQMMTNILHPIDLSCSKGVLPGFTDGSYSVEGARKGA